MCNINNILSNREIAILIWGIAYFLYAMQRSLARRSVANAFIALWKAPKALFVLVLFPALIGILLLSRFICLDLGAWKEILIWVVASALLSFSFEINEVKSIKGYFSVVWKIILSISFIRFAVDYTSFSIWWELLIVPMSFFLTKLYFFDELNQEENRDVKKLVNFLYYGFFIVLGYSLYKTIHSPGFWSAETFHTFIISPVLTTVYTLLAYPILLIVKYESVFKAINRIIDAKSRTAYRCKIWTFCKFNLNKISHCDFYIPNRTCQSSEPLEGTIDSVITSYKKQNNKYKFKIIRKDHNTTVENYHVFLDIKEINKVGILEFIDYFRKNHTKKQANISIYDDEIVTSFCYQNKGLSREQQSLLSKHWIAYSTFDAPLCVLMYPENNVKL